MIERFNTKAEAALRNAFTSVARVDDNPVESAFAVLDSKERTEAIGMAIVIAGYVTVEVCGARWPSQANIRQIAGDLATTGEVARRLELDPGHIYEYLSQVVLGREGEAEFAADEPSFARLAVTVAQRVLVVYAPKGSDAWDYLDQVESAIETAWALKPEVLSAALLRALMPKAPSGDVFAALRG